MNPRLLEEKSRAKINLHLAVLNRRGDGYHNISSLMAGLELSDTLTLRGYNFSANSGVEISIIDAGGDCGYITSGIEPGGNLISVGAANYLKRINTGGSLEFSIVKNIPSGAGLGGGSSNAACAIELVRLALGRERDEAFYSAAAETGSDVPFFLYGGFAFASGRGEIIEPYRFNCDCHVILVNNGIHVNTAQAYKALNRGLVYSGPGHMESAARIKEVLGNPGLWKDVMKNDFEEAIFPVYPELLDIKEKLYGLGADYAAMTGSGSTVFGVYSNYNRAVEACNCLKKGNNALLTKFAH